MKYKPNALIPEACNTFWQQQPALLYGLATLMGCSAALSGHPSLTLPIAVLYSPLFLAGKRFPQLTIRLFLSLIVLLSSFGLCTLTYQWPTLPSQGVYGVAELSINKLTLGQSSFGQSWIYEGEIRRFMASGSDDKAIDIRRAPVQILVTARDPSIRPQANSAYRVFGTLKQRHGGYQFKVGSATKWAPIPQSWSLAESRYTTKDAVAKMIKQHMQNPRAAGFITGLLTGDFSDRQISSTLGRFGLQHLMAISGFHFAIIASLVGGVLGTILQRRTAIIALMAILTAYLLFLGPGASVMRAWVGAMIGLTGQLLSKRARGLNNLGLALLILLCWDPALSQTAAFQLSFLATASILLFYPAIELVLRKILPKRSLSQVITVTMWDQHGVVFLAMLRGALALGIAVHLAMTPMTLYYFQKFPWLSIAFNLFFPFLVSISMLLILVALPLQILIPPLADALYAVNGIYTQWVLNLTLAFPTSLDLYWRVAGVSNTILLGYLCVWGMLGIAVFQHMENEKEEHEVFAFL